MSSLSRSAEMESSSNVAKESNGGREGILKKREGGETRGSGQTIFEARRGFFERNCFGDREGKKRKGTRKGTIRSLC